MYMCVCVWWSLGAHGRHGCGGECNLICAPPPLVSQACAGAGIGVLETGGQANDVHNHVEGSAGVSPRSRGDCGGGATVDAATVEASAANQCSTRSTYIYI